MTINKRHLKKILAIRLGSMGELLMTQPALRSIKESVPAAEVTLLTSSSASTVTHMLREIDRTIIADVPWVRNDTQTDSSELERLITKIRKEDFDTAFIFSVYSQSSLPAAFLLYAAHIPVRIAFSRENPYKLLTHWKREEEPKIVIRHEVERQLSLTKFMGMETSDISLRLKIDSKDQERAISLLLKKGVDPDKRMAVVHPGASDLVRRYNPGAYSHIITHLTSVHGYQVVVTGSREESRLAEFITKNSLSREAVNLTGATTTGMLAAVIERSSLFIGNNSGPAHLSAGVGTPAVILYALTNTQHQPWNIPSKILHFSAPCTDCRRGYCLLPAGHSMKSHLNLPLILQNIDDLIKETHGREKLGGWETNIFPRIFLKIHSYLL
ncbi:MAG: ADP-heptose-LPS heptosyltransferase II [Candidatus Gottesmanbacteria bacterium GW2011_GWA2_43_14]|uniref:ADP-heptose-LPS heptosyltransferase II n=1 Tax=Candidatus Gottesmanbacteria bacterium GW2011_GWA2_43_14 TaxID=1618443 RepID=A0A0G1DFF7_9BACT|nr:MAG: ADP-heptose-LPS heptosyltransferase II [Candidatus Gottesmanbacteria bacterium GW2011_GWA2_43_14]